MIVVAPIELESLKAQELQAQKTSQRYLVARNAARDTGKTADQYVRADKVYSQAKEAEAMASKAVSDARKEFLRTGSITIDKVIPLKSTSKTSRKQRR